MLSILFNHNSPASWFAFIIVVIVMGSCYLTFFVSRGFSFYYRKLKINVTIKKILLFTHILGSLILALTLPNNYLNEYPIINDYYTKTGFGYSLRMCCYS